MIKKILLLLATTIGLAWGQGSGPARLDSLYNPMRTGTALPATCRTGQMFGESDADSGKHFNICFAGVWFRQGIGTPYLFTPVLWEDLRAPAGQLSQGATPADACSFGPSGGLRALCFGNTEDVTGEVQIPHNAKVGSKIEFHPHIHWANPDTTACNVKWNIEYSFANVDGVFGAPTLDDETTAAGTVAWTHHKTELTTIVVPTLTVSNMIMFRVFRTAADTADCGNGATVEPRLLEVDFHYQVDSLGSATEDVK